MVTDDSAGAFNVEGITLQHVGELVDGTEKTQSSRHACRANYLRSLEDFTFAALFGRKLLVAKSIPALGSAHVQSSDAAPRPGQSLLDSLPHGFREPINIPDNRAAAAYLRTEPRFRELVLADIERLSASYEAGSEYYRGFYIRETKAHLGEHKTLFDPDLSPELYEFDEDHYVHDDDLNRRVPSGFLRALVPTVDTVNPHSLISHGAVREFISRSIVTHVTTMWAYELAIAGQAAVPPVRLPFSTRSAIIRARLDAAAKPADDEGFDNEAEAADKSRETARLLRRIRDVAVPHALVAVLGDGKVERRSFVDALLQTRDTSLFRDIRALLAPLLNKLAADKNDLSAADRGEIQNLLAEVTRAGTRVEGTRQFEIDLFDFFTLRFAFDPSNLVPTWVASRSARGRILMRRLVATGNYSDRRDYVARVAAVFPELGETPPE